jgi:hypothetical protein
METLFGLLRKKQVAWFFLIVATVSAFAWGWACKINYTTTFTQLSKVTPREAAIMFTVAIQSFEFLIPTLAVLGIMKALKVSSLLELGLGIAWVVVIAVDFMTALQYFIGAYEVTTFWSWVLSAVLAAMFLVAEMLFVLSLITMYVVYKMLAKGTVPDWIMDPEKDTVDIPDQTPRGPLFKKKYPAKGSFFQPSPVPSVTPTSPATSQSNVRPKASEVPDGTKWTAPSGNTYVVRNRNWEKFVYELSVPFPQPA